MMVHGYAQRTSNEWPGVGLSVPAWLSDYSNGLMVESGGNMVRWMHVTPWKQDVESCDRVGLPQAMPAGDAEKDVEGARWQQRTALMRDAIIYNRNNPSILFYECGNESISREHIHITPTRRVKTDQITIRLRGAGKDKDAFGGIVEVAEPAAGELDLFKAKDGGNTKSELRIVEVEFLKAL